ncbi:hypothetical protein C1752_00942 [Acaryochloris thomasi RCC1774]|uniref:KGK domain-containing protein n=1 Tax=Acaryochloris thomasi RCC1774 TaxID=1764569 RepID=A0A2W1JNK9_9CYAN|nr:KGK domain-containing protein [Acaryochloris thomasi]PZD74879.1 hypothetical protein C1752_00942 [Acaryochloris thomasi RCC1774]
MNYSNPKFKPFNDEGTAVSISSNMFKQKELMQYALTAFQDHGLNQLGKMIWDEGRGKFPIDKPENYREAWFTDGLDCEILEPSSQGWQKGKVRFKVTLEFYPDEPEMNESGLDALREPSSYQNQ